MQQLNTFQDQCLRLSQEEENQIAMRRSRVEVRKLGRVNLRVVAVSSAMNQQSRWPPASEALRLA